MDEESELTSAVAAVCAALHAHALICEAGVATPGEVIASAVSLRGAVSAYELVLSRVTHWSSPIRHMGPAVPFRPRLEAVQAPLNDFPLTARVTVSYDVGIIDSQEVTALIRGRYGEDGVSDVADALRMFVESEGWDPASVLGPTIRLTGAHAEIDLHRSGG